MRQRIIEERQRYTEQLSMVTITLCDFSKTNGGKTALQQAAGNGHEVAVRQLLEHNGDDASYKKWVATAQLYQASMDSNAAVMQQLIDDGAHIKAKDIGGETAVDRAAHFKYEAVMRVLLQRNAAASAGE